MHGFVSLLEALSVTSIRRNLQKLSFSFYSDGWIYTFLQISGPFGEDDSGTFLVQ